MDRSTSSTSETNPFVSRIYQLILTAVIFTCFPAAFAQDDVFEINGQEVSVSVGPKPTYIPGEDVNLVENNGMSTGPANTGLYIVEFSEPPVSRFIAGQELSVLANTGVDKPIHSNMARNHSAFLTRQHSAKLAQVSEVLGRKVVSEFDYQYAFNGVALKLSDQEVKLLSELSEILSITSDRLYALQTHSSTVFVEAPRIWDGAATPNGVGTRGEGVIIGVIDSGINSGHPKFAAVSEDGYTHQNPFGSGNFTGRCALSVDDPLYFPNCNDKLIGAYNFVDAIDSGSAGPEDDIGHGSAVAGVIAGNVFTRLLTAPTTDLPTVLSGVAPRANLIVCDACNDISGNALQCPLTAITACFDALVADGVDVINYSIGGDSMPWTNPASVSMLNATAAGIVVSTTTGGGFGAVSHLEPWAISTGLVQDNNAAFTNAVIGIEDGLDTLPDISGLGFTGSYGPAPIVYAGDYDNGSMSSDPEDCLVPFPDGTFNGEIVICDQGGSRVFQGQNVQSGGAGGVILAATETTGDFQYGDSFTLPGVSIGVEDGQTLRDWLALHPNATGSISGVVQDDVFQPGGNQRGGVNGFGPGAIPNLLKPDVMAPGTSIITASLVGDGPAPEFRTRTGISISSAHAAGAAALMKALHPDWTPYAIKSALMMTGNTTAVPSAEVTAHLYGGGTLNVARAANVGLVMDETAANMLAANPQSGGNPGELNLAGLQENQCLGQCSWTRTFTSVANSDVSWEFNAQSPGLALDFSPQSFTLAPGASQTVTITANVGLVLQPEWHYGQVLLNDSEDQYPQLALPVAAQVVSSTTTDPVLLQKTVDEFEVEVGDVVTYTIQLSNDDTSPNSFSLVDTLPISAELIEGSEAISVIGGVTTQPLSYDSTSRVLSWEGQLSANAVDLVPSTSPMGFVSLADMGVEPFVCEGSCNNGTFEVSGFSFDYFGQTYQEALVSIDGSLYFGNPAFRQFLWGAGANILSPAQPQNFIAPYWADFSLELGGNIYQASLQVNGVTYAVFSWEAMQLVSGSGTYSFQLWLQEGTSNFWFVYDDLGTVPSTLSVGFEDASAFDGVEQYYWFTQSGAAPSSGDVLQGVSQGAGSATITYDVSIGGSGGEVLLNVVEITGSGVGGVATAALEVQEFVDTDADGVADFQDNCTLLSNADQRDTNSDGFGNVCDPDMNNDGVVNFLDIVVWREFFNTNDNGDADFNDDGVVNFIDFALFPDFFFMPPGPSGLVGQ